MFRQLAVTAYDCLDRVDIIIRLYEIEGSEDAPDRWTTVAQTSIDSTGEEDRTEWARDALIAAVEAL
jgi:hypothetical protein